MASPGTHDTGFIYVHLPYIHLSNKKVRFIKLDRMENVIVPKSINKNEGMALFLGTDALAGTSYLPKNYNRIYTRYAKNGLATKLSPKNFQFMGIKHGSSLWFFNTEGLFKVVFEYQPKDVQKDCLSMLKELWLQQYSVPALRENLTVQVSGEATDPTECNIQHDIIGTRITSDICCDENAIKVRNVSDNVTPGLCVAGIRQIDNAELLRSQNFDRKSDNDYGKTADQEREGERPQEVHVLVSYDKKGNKLCSKYTQTKSDFNKGNNKSKCDASTQTEIQNQFVYDTITDLCTGEKCESNLLAYLHLIKIELKQPLAERFFCNLSDMYLKFINHTEHDSYVLDGWNLSFYKNAFLLTVCDWLGSELRKFETVISKRVESFKRDHINCIDNLPPSESIINLVFPPCMKILIMNWLGHGDTEKQNSAQALSDHDYSPLQKRSRSFQHEASWYPLVQHILEFANNALVSGVAHVVYSRLRHAL